MVPRRFKPEFKRRAVEEWVSGGKRIAEVCRKYQLSDSLVRNWRKQYEAKGPSAWDAASESQGERTAAEQRIAELEAALGRATMEADFLKRALRRAGLPFPPELKW
jgi:transposase-like protein